MKITHYLYNAFIIEESDIKFAIDPGKKLELFNHKSQIPEDDWQGITHIFATHGDPDHFDYADKMAGDTGAKVYCGNELIGDFSHGTAVQAVGVNETLTQPEMSVQGLVATHGPLPVRLGWGLLDMRNEVRSGTRGGHAIFMGPFQIARMEKEMPVQNHGTVRLLFGLIRLEKDNIPFARGAMGFKITVGSRSIVNLGDSLLRPEWEGLKPDVLMIPIGGDECPNTMGVDDAVEAVKLIQPEIVIPTHYNLPFLWQKNLNPADDQRFQAAVRSLGINCHIMHYGDQIDID